MEKIRTYDLAGVSRAVKFTHHTREGQEDLFASKREIHLPLTDRQLYALQLSDAMYQTHKEWVDSKMKPIIPYLQRKIPHRTEHEIQTTVDRQYKLGLRKTMASLVQLTGGKIDIQDSIASYTAGFVSILRVCERFDVNGQTALTLAQQPHNLTARKLTQLLQNNPGFPQIVAERAATYPNPDRIFQSYKDKVLEAKRLSFSEAFADVPESVLFDAVGAMHDTQGYLHRYHQNANPLLVAESPRKFSKTMSVIKDIPLLKQKHTFWCPETTASMVLQHYGYSDLTPEKIFMHANGEYDPILESIDPSWLVSIDDIALAVKEMTSLRVDLWTKDKFEKLKEKNPNRTPIDVLNAYVLKRNVPCIVRTPGHFVVVAGADPEQETYYIKNPYGRAYLKLKTDFEKAWGNQEDAYPRDSRYLMLAIYPPSK